MTAEIKKFKTFRDLKTVPVKIEDTSITSTTSNTSKPSISSITSTTNITEKTAPSNTSISRTPKTLDKKQTSETKERQNRTIEVSPTRDFQKIPNSVVRDALPQGTFKGKSKHVYDYLWSISRGAIKPEKSVRASRQQIKKGSGLGSMVTVDAAIDHLEKIGLIKVTSEVGSLKGNEYEVLAPEEISIASPSTPSIASTSSPTQKLDELVIPETSITRTTETIENKDIYVRPKTLFKDFEPVDDDSPLIEALRLLNAAAKRATGKGLTQGDWKAFLDFVQIFVNETDLAAGRTSSVSSYIALGAENIKRRLYPKKKEKLAKKQPKNWQSVGEYENESIEGMEPEEVEPLSETARENALIILRGILRDSTIEQIQPLAASYTHEDWNWLMRELKK